MKKSIMSMEIPHNVGYLKRLTGEMFFLIRVWSKTT